MVVLAQFSLPIYSLKKLFVCLVEDHAFICSSTNGWPKYYLLNTYLVEAPETFTCLRIADSQGEKRGLNP